MNGILFSRLSNTIAHISTSSYLLTCTCGGNQAFPPRPATMILETFLDHVVQSSASCSAKTSHWVDHLWPNFLKPPIGSRSDLARFHQFFLCPPWRLFHELIGSTRSIWWGRCSGGFRNTWPNRFKRRLLIVSATSLNIAHSKYILVGDTVTQLYSENSSQTSMLKHFQCVPVL